MIIVGTPTRESVHAAMATDLISLLSFSSGTEWRVGFGTIIPNNRTLLVHHAARAEASHILFIDSDMRFPRDALQRLLARGKDIVGANYRQRTRNEWVAYKDDEFISSIDRTGLEKVESLGFGLILVKMTVFTDRAKGVPPNAFATPFDTSTGLFVGEDVHFCAMARDAGFTVWVDHDLSQEIKHIGSVELGV